MNITIYGIHWANTHLNFHFLPKYVKKTGLKANINSCYTKYFSLKKCRNNKMWILIYGIHWAADTFIFSLSLPKYTKNCLKTNINSSHRHKLFVIEKMNKRDVNINFWQWACIHWANIHRSKQTRIFSPAIKICKNGLKTNSTSCQTSYFSLSIESEY